MSDEVTNEDVLVQELHLPSNEEVEKVVEESSEIPDAAVNTPPRPGEEPLFSECAFIMYLSPDGHWTADTNLTRQVTSARPATLNDFYHAAAVVQKDLEAAETAQRVLIGQQQMAQHMAEQMQTAELAKQIGGPVGKGIADLSQLRRR